MRLKRLELEQTLKSVSPVVVEGRVKAVIGMCIRATLPAMRTGDIVAIDRDTRAPLRAQVVGFDGGFATLMPFGTTDGIAPEQAVRRVGDQLTIRCGPGLIGRVVDALGEPLDGRGAVDAATTSDWAIMREAPRALDRVQIREPLPTGIRAIDGLLTLGVGQRIGIFAGSGIGKSSLLAQLARQTQADVYVLALVGERGREALEFIEEGLGDAGLKRGVIVCATSDEPPLTRKLAAYTATAVAEYFRDQGQRVLLVMDSLTRFARAAREAALAAGEPPVRRGFPPSVFAELPQLLERAGNAKRGSITAVYSVLVEGDDLDEPIGDEVRGLLDGHIVLSRELFARGRLPAVDITRSISRVMPRVVALEHCAAATQLRADVAYYESKRDLVLLGAYQPRSDARLDAILKRIDRIEAFLTQSPTEAAPCAESIERLLRL